MHSFPWSPHTLLFSVNSVFSVLPIPLFHGFRGGSWVEGATNKTRGKGCLLMPTTLILKQNKFLHV